MQIVNFTALKSHVIVIISNPLPFIAICLIFNFQHIMDNHFTIETADHHRKLFLELHKLQQHRVACDVAIAAEDGEISAHRIILMSASKYFRKRIMSVMHESNPRIYLQGRNRETCP